MGDMTKTLVEELEKRINEAIKLVMYDHPELVKVNMEVHYSSRTIMLTAFVNAKYKGDRV